MFGSNKGTKINIYERIEKAIAFELISLGIPITPYLRTLPFGDVLNVPFPSIVELYTLPIIARGRGRGEGEGKPYLLLEVLIVLFDPCILLSQFHYCLF